MSCLPPLTFGNNEIDERERRRVEQLIRADRLERVAAIRAVENASRSKMKRRAPAVVVVDATPERLAMSASEFVNPAKIDSSEQRIGNVRRLIAEPLDRWLKAGVITLRQHDAGDWWRTTAHRAELVPTGRQGMEPQSRGVPMYGFMARTEKAVAARQSMRDIGTLLSADDRRLLDRLCIAGEITARGRQGQTGLQVVRLSLDRLATALRLPAK